jgi:hypothetical protein
MFWRGFDLPGSPIFSNDSDSLELVTALKVQFSSKRIYDVLKY